MMTKIFVRNTSRGFGLVEVLIATAISAALALILATLMGNMAFISNVYSAKADYDELYRVTQLVLLNDTLCAQALVQNGKPATFNPDTAPNNQVDIDTIFMANQQGPGGSTIASTIPPPPPAPQTYTTRIKVSRLFLTEHQPNTGRSTVVVQNGGTSVTYNTYVADLNIQVQPVSIGLTSIGIKPISLVIGVDQSTFQIKTCYATTSNASLCAILNSSLDPSTGQCILPPCPGPVPPSCTPPGVDPTTCTGVTYFTAFTSTGSPTCQCVQTCPGPAGPAGPPGQDYAYPVYVGGGGY